MKVLRRIHFQQSMRADQDSAFGLACHYGESICNIGAVRKHAIDQNHDSPRLWTTISFFHACAAASLGLIGSGTLDFAFTSSFFDYFPDKAELHDVLAESTLHSSQAVRISR